MPPSVPDGAKASKRSLYEAPYPQRLRELLITQDRVHWVTCPFQHLEHSRSLAIVGQPQASGLTEHSNKGSLGVGVGAWKQLLIWSVLESIMMSVKFMGHSTRGDWGKRDLRSL